MHICFIMDNPETMHHPVIASALDSLNTTHTVRLLDVNLRTSEQALAEEQRHPMDDLYLLKSHAMQALDVAYHLEQRGAHVVNSWVSTCLCRDRALFCQQLQAVGLPTPTTHSIPELAGLFEHSALLDLLSFPVMVKSRYSRRGDLVTKVESVEQLASYASEWSKEPVILQEFVPGDGWDIKLWVIGKHVFAARRRTPLEAGSKKTDYPLTAHTLPAEWMRIAQAIGKTFDLHLYGVDLLVSGSHIFIVDVNSFPGFRGVPEADSALVELVEQLHVEKTVCP